LISEVTLFYHSFLNISITFVLSTLHFDDLNIKVLIQ